MNRVELRRVFNKVLLNFLTISQYAFFFGISRTPFCLVVTPLPCSLPVTVVCPSMIFKGSQSGKSHRTILTSVRLQQKQKKKILTQSISLLSVILTRSPVCIRVCFTNELDVVNDAPHTSQPNGCNPVCFRVCASNSPFETGNRRASLIAFCKGLGILLA